MDEWAVHKICQKKHPPWLLAALVKIDEKVEIKKKLVSGDVILLSLLDGPSKLASCYLHVHRVSEGGPRRMNLDPQLFSSGN